MDEQQEKSLLERVARLEQTVEDLRLTLGLRAAAGPGAAAQAYSPATLEVPLPGQPAAVPVHRQAGAHAAAPRRRALPDDMYRGEYWLGKVGIGLVLFGVAFLFKYSIDRGWLTEPVRLGCGLAIGTVLFIAGVRIHAGRRHFSQVLLGGAFATFYLTGFAAFQLYRLVPWPAAFAFMAAATLLSFCLSVGMREMVLALIGTVGGLGTPFLLYTPEGSLPGLAGYTCLVLGGAAAVYLYRGWRPLLEVSAIGGVVVFSIVAGQAAQDAPLLDRWASQVGVVFAWLAVWAMPVLRDLFQAQDPGRWPDPSPGWMASGTTTHLLTLLMPIPFLILSRVIWRLPGEAFGWAVLAASLVYGLVAWGLRSRRLERLAYTHAVAALAMLTVAFCLLLEGKALLLTLTVEAAALHLVSSSLRDRVLEVCGHVLFGIVGCWLAVRLLSVVPALFWGKGIETEGTAVFNLEALTSLAAIAAALGVSRILRSGAGSIVYRIAAHLAVLAWLLRELGPLPDGQAYVSIAWGVYGLALLVAGLRLDLGLLRNVALGTLFLVVAKLFLVDLASLEALWRILLFLCFGGVFLLLGYYFQALWKRPSAPGGGTL